MKTQDMLIIGAVGIVLLLAMQKKANAAAAVNRATLPANQTGGAPQPGVSYTNPQQVAGVVAGAVNGILNWVSGTPDSSQNPTPSPAKSVEDSMASIWDNLGKGFGSLGGDNPQDGALSIPGLANSWLGSLEGLG